MPKCKGKQRCHVMQLQFALQGCLSQSPPAAPAYTHIPTLALLHDINASTVPAAKPGKGLVTDSAHATCFPKTALPNCQLSQAIYSNIRLNSVQVHVLHEMSPNNSSPVEASYKRLDAFRWLQQITTTLKYLHSLRPMVVHCDLNLKCC